jgi:hypothetical protein
MVSTRPVGTLFEIQIKLELRNNFQQRLGPDLIQPAGTGRQAATVLCGAGMNVCFWPLADGRFRQHAGSRTFAK